MIKNSVIIAFILFFFYSIYIIQEGQKKRNYGQHQWQNNIIRAQNFLYDQTGNFKKVIVGSSLSTRLNMDLLKGFYNLSFSARSIFDGLEILSYKEELPSTVFVEMNVIMRGKNYDFISSITSLLPFTIKKYLPSLREQNQPISIFGGGIMIPIMNKFFKRIKSPDSMSATIENNSQTQKIFSKMLAIVEKEYAVPPDNKALNDKFLELRKWIDFFESRKVRIVFFEMPVHPTLCDLPLAKKIREAFFLNFPSSHYNYIPSVSCAFYATTDGIHLNSDDANTYSDHFRKEAVLIENSPGSSH